MTKRTLKILLCKHCKFKYVWSFFNIIERAKKKKGSLF